MKLIIAGGRHYNMTPADHKQLDAILTKHQVTEIVSGGAAGADAAGEEWARSRGLPIKRFPAMWTVLTQPDAMIKTRWDGTQYDARAGFRRNEQMAQYANAGALFKGGSGTADMRNRAKKHQLTIFELG
jgi:predicted Rossmann-fold nucleotide-binding protein